MTPTDHPTPEQVAEAKLIVQRCRNPVSITVDETALVENIATALRNAAKVGDGHLLTAVQAHVGIFRSGSCVTIGDMERLEAAMQAAQRGAGAER